MVTLMSRWPATSWAICGGMPCMIASVMNILRKSCGVNRSGAPLTSVSPVPASVSSEQAADAVGLMRRFSSASGIGTTAASRVPDLFVVVVGRDERDAAGRSRIRVMIALSTSASSGEMTRSRSGRSWTGRSAAAEPVHRWREPILDQAVMAEFGELLNTDAGQPEDFHGNPGPKSPSFFGFEITALSGVGILGPQMTKRFRRALNAPQEVLSRGELLAGFGGHRCGQRLRGAGAPVHGGRDAGWAAPGGARGCAGPSATCGGSCNRRCWSPCCSSPRASLPSGPWRAAPGAVARGTEGEASSPER